MISAWVLFCDVHESGTNRYRFEERNGAAGYDTTKPEDWGLDPAKHLIIAVFQQASFLQAWLRGVPLKDR